jgi:dTDP-4-amino-4,6-dideoxygalactose transaminase/acetyltransferase-like isoleucine patch superfamily enzyme
VVPPQSFIHPTALVEPGAAVGKGTTVWHHSHVRGGSVVGEGCTLGKNVYVDEGVRIGDRVKIQNNVSVYRGVELADDVFVGPSAVFTNDLRPRAANQDWRVSATQVRRGASIGANATVVCGVELGEYAMIGAGAVVTASVRPHQLVTGNPSRHHGWVCRCGGVVSRATAPPGDLRCGRCRGQREPDGGLAGSGNARIRLAKAQLGAAEEEAVLRVLRSGRLAGGAGVAEFERCFARAHGAAHAVAVSSGTAALVAAFRAHRLGPGDEVITTPLTFGATLNAILEVGATARFADIADDFTLDPASAAALVTPRTRALMPVHLYGLPAAMAAISEIATRHGLAVIEDAAQAHGARVGATPVGSTGTAAFSLYGTKNITCGEGGIVTTDDGEIAARLRLLRNHGMREAYDYALPGHNYRLTDLQAVIATAQLRRLATVNGRRARNAGRLSAGLAGVPGLVLPAAPAGRLHAWHLYSVRVTSDARMDRDQLGKCLDAAGIESRPYYPRLVHHYRCYIDHPQVVRDQTPRASRFAQEVLSLPVHPALTDDDIDRIVACVREALTGCAGG